jgi:hypothetical protein
MKYTAKKTDQLTRAEVQQIAELFGTVFGQKRSVDQLQSKYRSVVTGYSYHGLMLNDAERIVGAFTCIPFFYNYFGTRVIFALAVDTMIDQAHRDDIFSLKRMHDSCVDLMKTEDIALVMAVPNDNAYLYWKKIVKWMDIGRLYYYVLPINISRLNDGYRFLNPVSRLYASMSRFFFCTQAKSFSEKNIYKITDHKFVEYRFSKNYSKIEQGNKTAYYRVYHEKETRTAYLIDLFPIERSWLQRAVGKIYIRERGNIDLILYAGKLDFRIYSLIKVPEKHEPLKIFLTGKIVNSSRIDDRVYQLDNWRFNLADFDVR